MIEVREKLRRARVLAGWSQDKCDQVADVKPGRTYSYERGRAVPNTEYLSPLAEAWSIPLTWFFDGKDDLPARQTGPASDLTVPIFPPIPCHNPTPLPDLGQKVVKVEFPVASGAFWTRIADTHLRPYLNLGDWILVSPGEMLDDTLAVIEYGGQVNVVNLTRVKGEIMAEPVTERYALPGKPWEPRGIVVEAQRREASGLVIAYECERGLSKDMLSNR